MATIKDVARIAGVSVSTVSHVVNGTRYVSPEKVRRVEDAIRQLDELPNFIAETECIEEQTVRKPLCADLAVEKTQPVSESSQRKAEEIVEQKGYIAISLAYDLDEDRLAAHRALAGTLALGGNGRFPGPGRCAFRSLFQRTPVSGGSDWEPRGSVCRRHPAARHL